MVRHLDVQQKAQAEIDRVVGRDRLPTYADREKLPYTNAVLSEVLRILPPISASTPWFPLQLSELKSSRPYSLA